MAFWPGLDDRNKLVLAHFIIGCLGVCETQWLRSLVQESIRDAQFSK